MGVEDSWRNKGIQLAREEFTIGIEKRHRYDNDIVEALSRSMNFQWRRSACPAEWIDGLRTLSRETGKIADFGDLYWNQEHELVCPIDKLGIVDLYVTTHHGTATSGSPACQP